MSLEVQPDSKISENRPVGHAPTRPANLDFRRTARVVKAWRQRRRPRGAERGGGREGRDSPRGQEPRVPGGDHPGGRPRVRPQRPRGLRRVRRRASGRRSPTTSSPPAGATILPDRRRGVGDRRPGAQGQGADRRGVPPDARRAGAVHLPAPGRVEGVHRRAGRPARSPASRTRRWRLPDRSLPLLAPMSEVAGRLAPQVGAYHLMRQGGGRGVLMGGVSGRVRGQGRRHRRRRLRHERGRDRARHAGRGAAAGQEHRTKLRAADAHLPGPPADRRLQRVRDRAGRARRRPGDRRGAGARAPRRRRWSPTTWSRG